MKKFAVTIGILALFTITGCTSSNEEEQGQNEINNKSENSSEGENIIDNGEVTLGYWIDTNGNLQENSEMINSGPIQFHSDKSYWLNKTAYVSYYNGDEFLETILYDYKNDFPTEIESIKEADNIFLSFNEKNIDIIELIEE